MEMAKDGKGATPDDPIQVDVVEPTPTDGSSPRLSSKILDESPIANGGGITEVASTKSPPQQAPTQDEPRPPPQNVTVPFIPKFKGAEAMAARRRIRLMNRSGAPMRPAVIAPVALNPELSSSSESSSESESESDVPEEEHSADEDDFDDDDDDAPDVDDSIADEFDP